MAQLTFTGEYLRRIRPLLIQIIATSVFLPGYLAMSGSFALAKQPDQSGSGSLCYQRRLLKKALPMTEIVPLPELKAFNGERDRFLAGGVFTRSTDFSIKRGHYDYGNDYVRVTVDSARYVYRFCAVTNVLYLSVYGPDGYRRRFPIAIRSIK